MPRQLRLHPKLWQPRPVEFRDYSHADRLKRQRFSLWRDKIDFQPACQSMTFRYQAIQCQRHLPRIASDTIGREGQEVSVNRPSAQRRRWRRTLGRRRRHRARTRLMERQRLNAKPVVPAPFHGLNLPAIARSRVRSTASTISWGSEPKPRLFGVVPAFTHQHFVWFAVFEQHQCAGNCYAAGALLERDKAGNGYFPIPGSSPFWWRNAPPAPLNR